MNQAILILCGVLVLAISYYTLTYAGWMWRREIRSGAVGAVVLAVGSAAAWVVYVASKFVS
ncbi:MAG: hypothetical protein OWT27_00325 [Firmicutes bacterium]|nr:hypothetical protein [Bacillota bacterium]